MDCWLAEKIEVLSLVNTFTTEEDKSEDLVPFIWKVDELNSF